MTHSQRSLLGTIVVLAFSLSSLAVAEDKKSGDQKPAAASAHKADTPKPSTPPVDKASDKAKPAPEPKSEKPKLTPAPAVDHKENTAKPQAAEEKKEEKKNDNSLREQDIYIPYEKLRGVFEKHGRGVYMPYEKFEELWNAAQDKTHPAVPPRPPVGAVITEIENEAVVGKDVVQVTAHVKIDLLAEGWHEVPLRLADAAISRATIKNEPARILGGANEDHRLLIEHKGKQPEQVELLLEYARSISRSPGQNSVSFQAPQAAVSRWKVRIPQSGVKVNLHPLIAATEVPPAAATDSKKPAEETVVLAFIGAAPTVEIDWTPKAEGATGLTALASVQSEQVVWIQEGITRARTNLVYTISRAELKELSLEVPAEYKVVNVFDPNVRQWSVEPPAAGAPAGSGVQKITAQLFEPAKTTQAVVVELEKIAGRGTREAGRRQETLKAPVVKALNVGRQQGFVVAQVSTELRAEAAKTTGLLQIDAAELPPALRATPWAFAYRYAAVPFDLEFGLEEVQPRITEESLVEARLEPEKLSLDVTAYYNIERAGVFKLELDVPEGFEVRSVTGTGGAMTPAAGMQWVNYAATEVESHHLEGEKKNHLVVNLAHKAIGRVALKLQLQRDLHEPNLVAPTGKTSEIELPVPQPSKGSVEHSAGRLIVDAPESLRVNPAKADGLRPVSFEEARQGILMPPTPNGVVAPRPVLAFVFTQEPINLRLSAERRKPQVTIRQLLVARIEEGVVKCQATFHYTVLYSGVKSLRIDVPADVAPLLRNNTPGIHEKAIDPPPTDLEKNMVAWSLTGEGELLGEGDINLAWEKKLDKLDVGKPVPLDVPRLVPRDVDLAWGQIVLAKAETLDFQEGDELKGLRPIDPQRDIVTPVPGAARAFEFHDEWSLPVTVTRYELEEVKRTSIDRAVCRMVITPAGEISVQALYRVRSVRPRLSVQLPAKATPDSDPVRINGQPIMLQKGQNDALVVPLVNINAEEPFVLEIRYLVPAGEPLTLPAFVEDAAVQKVYLCAFVPAAQDVVGTGGTWSEDFQWHSDDGRWVPIADQTHEQRVAWVCEGNKAASDRAQTFHFDGTPLIFSTLRPDAQSTVRLWSIDHMALAGWIFCLTVLAGAGLVFTRFLTRLMAVAGLIVALVLLGLFWPTLSLHVLGPPFYWAIVITVIIWVVAAIARHWRQAIQFLGALGTTWSLWVASRKVIVPIATAVAAPTPPSPEKGETSHE